MRKYSVYYILLMLYILIACGKSQKSIADYESNIMKFAKSQFNSNNGEFSILLPKNWFQNEDQIDSDTVLYILESESEASNFLPLFRATVKRLRKHIAQR